MIDRDDILLSTIDIVKEDFNRNLCGVEQVKVGGIWVSLNLLIHEVTAQTGATYDLDGKITTEGLELTFPCHKDLFVTIYRNGILQPTSKWTKDDAGVVTFVDALDDDNLIFIFK
jgi:hypothetical protein